MQTRTSSHQLHQELIGYFIKYLEDQGDKSPGTIENIKRDSTAFIKYLEENNDADISPKQVLSYIDLIEDKYLESSFLSKLSSIRQFINWLNLDNNPFWTLKISFTREDFKYYSEKEIFSRFKKENKLDELLVRILYELHISIDELLNLEIANYNLASGCFKYRDSLIKASGKLAELLRFHLKDREASTSSITLNDPLLTDLNNQKLERNDVLKRLSSYDLKNIYLKRSRIINLLKSSLDPQEIEEMLGIKLSDFYRPFIKEKDYRLLSAYNEFHPRA